jgi:hypothetical protein
MQYYYQALLCITVERVFPTQVSGEGITADLGLKEQVCRLAGRTIMSDPRSHGAREPLGEYGAGVGVFRLRVIYRSCVGRGYSAYVDEIIGKPGKVIAHVLGPGKH